MRVKERKKIKKEKRKREKERKKKKERKKGKGREGKIIIHVPLYGALFWPYIDGCGCINS